VSWAGPRLGRRGDDDGLVLGCSGAAWPGKVSPFPSLFLFSNSCFFIYWFVFSIKFKFEFCVALQILKHLNINIT
jgi:hypothetical protein